MKKNIFYNSVGFMALLRREIDRFLKIYIQTLLAPLLSNILFLGVFGAMIKTRGTGIAGIDYLHFLVPGLCGMGAIFSAFQNPAFSIVAQKYQDIFKDMNSYPISDIEKVLSFILAGTFRGVLIGVLTYVSTVFFTGYHVESPVLFLLMLTFISFIFSSVGTAVGLVLETFEKINFILSIILTPMAYFGGVFFEVTKLHGSLTFLVYLNPLFPLINMLRYSYLGVYEGELVIQLIYIAILVIISFGTSYRLFKKGRGFKS